MEIKNMTRTARKVLDLGMMDVVDENGKLLEDVPEKDVMVRSGDDLANLPDKYLPGTYAHTAAWKKVWQLSAAGEWVEV